MASMTGVILGAQAMTGFKAGLADSIQTIQTTVNNSALGEIFIMFLGVNAIILGVLFIIAGFRGAYMAFRDLNPSEDSAPLSSFEGNEPGRVAAEQKQGISGVQAMINERKARGQSYADLL